MDDDEDDRFFFSEAFDGLKTKSKLSLFKDGQEFIDSLESNLFGLPDIVFLDFNMPKKNGLECLKYLRNNDKFSNVFVAIYTTSSSIRDMDATLQHGANLYIQKPANFGTLTTIIDSALKTCHQYAAPQLNKHSFLMKL